MPRFEPATLPDEHVDKSDDQSDDDHAKEDVKDEQFWKI